MMRFRTVAVTDAAAERLLTDYFASRAATFPAAMGAYQTTFPTPSHFESPRGTFLIASAGETSASETPADDPRASETPADDPRADLGCGGIRLIDHDAGVTRFELKHLWVTPAARGTGVGRALLTELETRARAFGATELVLDTNATQAAATQLYRSSGFEEIAPYNHNANATHWFAKNLTTELE